MSGFIGDKPRFSCSVVVPEQDLQLPTPAYPFAIRGPPGFRLCFRFRFFRASSLCVFLPLSMGLSPYSIFPSNPLWTTIQVFIRVYQASRNHTCFPIKIHIVPSSQVKLFQCSLNDHMLARVCLEYTSYHQLVGELRAITGAVLT